MDAVVSASHGALGTLLGKLNALLADECTRLKGVRREIRFLRSELSNMHAALQKYTTLEDPGVQVKAWISEVRELAYDVEDCIDKFIHQLGHHGDHGGTKEFFRKSARRLKTLGSRHQIANQIEELKARVVAVKDQSSSYKLDDIASGSSHHAAVDPRLSALFSEEAQVVGIEGPRDYLAKWLAEEDRTRPTKHRKVLCIVGFGGLGKTTMENEVRRKIMGQFHCHALLSLNTVGSTRSSYSGFIEEIWELDYVLFKIPLFRCRWVNLQHVKVDKYGVTTVELERVGYQDEQFVLANQVVQVFYVTDPSSKQRHVVLQGKRRIVGVDNVVDEEEYNQFDELPPIGTGITTHEDQPEEASYRRVDHREGLIFTQKNKQVELS